MNWTLVAPIGIEELKKEVALFYNLNIDELSESYYPVIIPGKGTNYSAAVSMEPGSEGLEMELGDFLSGKVKGELYLIFDSEDQYGVYAYRKGKKEPVRLEESINDFCEKTGVDLTAFRDAAIPFKSVVKTLCVIEGPSPSEVWQALGINEGTTGVYVYQLENGKILYYSDHGNIAVNVYNLMTVFPGPIYFIHHDMETGYFSCTLLEEGEESGIYEYPEYISDYIDELPTIDGASNPKQILDKLGVPSSLLGFTD